MKKAEKQGVILTSIGISGTNTTDPEVSEMWDGIIAVARKYSGIKHVNSFTVDYEEMIAAFTVVPDYSVPGRDKDIEAFREEVKEMHPDMMFKIRIGIDM